MLHRRQQILYEIPVVAASCASGVAARPTSLRALPSGAVVGGLIPVPVQEAAVDFLRWPGSVVVVHAIVAEGMRPDSARTCHVDAGVHGDSAAVSPCMRKPVRLLICATRSHLAEVPHQQRRSRCSPACSNGARSTVSKRQWNRSPRAGPSAAYWPLTWSTYRLSALTCTQ